MASPPALFTPPPSTKPVDPRDTGKKEGEGLLSGVTRALGGLFGSSTPDKQPESPSKQGGQIIPEGQAGGRRCCRKNRRKLSRRSTLRKTKQTRRRNK